MVVPGINEPKACSVNQIFKFYENNFGIDDVEEFSEGKTYYEGNVCRYGNKIYLFKEEHSGTWSDADAEETSLFSAIEMMKNEIEAYIGTGKEDIVISCSTKVPGASMQGLDFMVYLNGSDTGAKYTTDSNGQFVVQIPRGYEYRIVAPSVDGCSQVPDIIGTATTARNTYNVIYSSKSEGDNELVLIYLYDLSVLSGFNASTPKPRPDKEVKITIEGETSSYITNEQGMVMLQIERGKSYKVVLPKEVGYYMYPSVYEYSYTANSSKRIITASYFSTAESLKIICDNGSEYTFEEFKNGGIDINSARLLKISSERLASENAIFGIGVDELRARSYGNQTWQDPYNVQLNAVGNGYHYDGYTNCKALLAEAQSRNMSVNAIRACLNKTLATSYKSYNGFLGSVQQWIAIWNMKVLIDEVLAYLRPLDEGGNFTDQLTLTPKKGYNFSSYTGYKWTSDQYAAAYAYYFTSAVNNNNKNNSYAAVPFYEFRQR